MMEKTKINNKNMRNREIKPSWANRKKEQDGTSVDIKDQTK